MASLRWIVLGLGWVALAGCEESGPVRELYDTSVATTEDAEAAVVPRDGGSGSLEEPALSADASTLDAGDVDVDVDGGDAASSLEDAQLLDATSGPASARDGGPALVTPCTQGECCLALTGNKYDSSCPAESCLPQGQTFYIDDSDERHVRVDCSDSEYSKLRSYTQLGGLKNIELYVDKADCQVTDAARLRAAIWKVHVSHDDAELWAPIGSVSATGPASIIQELRIENGRLHVVVEAALDHAARVVDIGSHCGRGPRLPFEFCNCIYGGAGPKTKFVVDLPIAQ